ncbi:MAG: esterase/lipase family protein [Vulcanimicrobiota bacterium]
MIVSRAASNPVQRPRPEPSAHHEQGEKHSAIRDCFGPVVDDLYLLTRFVGVGQTYKMVGARLAERNQANPPLADLKPVQLDQPIVLIPGWTTLREALQPLGDKLTEGGRNGGEIVFVQNGHFYLDRDCHRPFQGDVGDGGHKVFEVVFSDIRNPPPLGATELSRNFEAIKQVTGVDKLDVSAYSMGGLATRVYLDRGGDSIGKLMLLGTPNQGTTFANLAGEILRRDIGWAISMAGLQAADLPALEWLSVDDGKGSNPHLQDLNAHWDRQIANVDQVLAVGGRGILTPSRGLFPVTLGDGLVEAGGMAPPSGPVKILDGEHHHSHLNNDPEVYQTMMDYFGWQPD